MNVDAHAKHCFVAIPFGQTEEERMFFQGWLNEVILPTLDGLGGLTVEVAASSSEPTSITAGIFEHLLHDRLAVFDLAGVSPIAPANPNVMYELGIRHAFRLPSLILAWKNQPLPFDIGDQRAVKVDRIAFHFADARTLIREFAMKALDGKFYDPLASFEHRATVAAAALGNDPLLKAIASQLEEVSNRVGALQTAEEFRERERQAEALRARLRGIQVTSGAGGYDGVSTGPSASGMYVTGTPLVLRSSPATPIQGGPVVRIEPTRKAPEDAGEPNKKEQG